MFRHLARAFERISPWDAVWIGSALTILVFLGLRDLEDRNAQSAFQGVAHERFDALETNVALTLNSLVSLGAYFDASQLVERSEFEAFTSSLLAHHRAIHALEWIPLVPRRLRRQYENAARRDGIASFQFTERIRQGEMTRAAERDEYFPVFYVGPLRGNEKALGFDLASDGTRREALERARATRRMASTGRVVLVQENEDRYGFLVFSPVYVHGALTGFALAVFRIQDIIERVRDGDPGGIAVVLEDLDARPGERLLYTQLATPVTARGPAGRPGVSRTIEVAGRRWMMSAYPLRGAFAPARSSSWLGLTAGMLLVALLAGYLQLLLSRKEAVEQMVAERTAALEAALQQLESSNQAVARSEGRHRKFVEVSTDAIVTCRRYAITAVNSAATRLFGVAGPEDMIGRRLSDFASPRFREIALRTEELTLATEMQMAPVEGEIVRADQSTVEVEISLCSFFDDGPATVQAVLRDISHRKRAEAELVKARDLAEGANRAKSLFLATVSHELRTPLNAILGFAELMQLEMADRGISGWLREVGMIRGAGTRLLLLVNDILDLSKAEAGKMQLGKAPFEVSAVVREVVAELEPAGAKNRNEIRVLAEPATLFGDRMRVQQCLLNLVGNACKFTAEGHIVVEGRNTDVDGAWYELRVTDTGIGIAADQAERLFADFSQVDSSATRRYGGTGLGLALSRRLCRLMGGDITVVSALGEGSTFTMRIPVGEAGDSNAPAVSGKWRGEIA